MNYYEEYQNLLKVYANELNRQSKILKRLNNMIKNDASYDYDLLVSKRRSKYAIANSNYISVKTAKISYKNYDEIVEEMHQKSKLPIEYIYNNYDSVIRGRLLKDKMSSIIKSLDGYFNFNHDSLSKHLFFGCLSKVWTSRYENDTEEYRFLYVDYLNNYMIYVFENDDLTSGIDVINLSYKIDEINYVSKIYNLVIPKSDKIWSELRNISISDIDPSRYCSGHMSREAEIMILKYFSNNFSILT